MAREWLGEGGGGLPCEDADAANYYDDRRDETTCKLNNHRRLPSKRACIAIGMTSPGGAHVFAAMVVPSREPPSTVLRPSDHSHFPCSSAFGGTATLLGVRTDDLSRDHLGRFSLILRSSASLPSLSKLSSTTQS